MKTIIITLILSVSTVLCINSQVNSKNSFWQTNKDTLRVLLVFAEALNDTTDNVPGAWEKHEMPSTADDYFDTEFNGPENMQNFLTKYFYQASLGNFIVIGDYIDTLVQIDFNSLGGGDNFLQVTQWLNNLPGDDIITKHGYSINSNDFDKWLKPISNGYENVKGSNTAIDMIMVYWRINSKFTGSGSGHIYNASRSFPIKGKIGFDEISVYVDRDASPNIGYRHEYSHSLLGGNNFHVVSGAGSRKVMMNPGGWSLLSSWGKRGEGCNAWDRRRMGWIPVGTEFEIRAINPSTADLVNTDLIYGNPFPENTQEFILRDFISTGDALRIKLPYLLSENSNVFDQWIWLENHQFKSGYIDLNATNSTKGIYSYIQIGKEIMDSTKFYVYEREKNNYLIPLNAFGNFDIEISDLISDINNDTIYSEEGKGTNYSGKFIINSEYQNAFTGHNILSRLPYNIIDPDTIGGIIHYDKIKYEETLISNDIIVNGTSLPQSDYFNISKMNIFGTKHDAFVEGKKISLSTNPSITPVYTYETKTGLPHDDPEIVDNRKIMLNGLSIEVLNQYSNGDIKVRVRYDDFDIVNDVRWCGDIILNEQVNLLANKSITIDQGLTPTRPNYPVFINGENIYADTSIFTCKENPVRLRLFSA